MKAVVHLQKLDGSQTTHEKDGTLMQLLEWVAEEMGKAVSQQFMIKEIHITGGEESD